ncbi:MAG: TolC family protein, partial [Treponema socranskii subsp. buccale]
LIDVDADDLIATYGNSSLALRSLDNNIETLEHNLSALDFASFSPALSLNWNYQPMLRDAFDSNWFDKDNWNDNGAFSATLAWNVTNMLPFSSNRQKAKDLRANLEKLKISREQLTENQKLEVRTAINTLDQAKRQIASMQRNVELAQRSYAMTLRSYQNGTTELLDLRDAERQLNQARLGLANQRYQYITALLNLEETLNTDLTVKSAAATTNGGTR